MTRSRPDRTVALAALALALMLFLYLTAEVFTAGALLPMARSLGVGAGAVGMLVMVYAVVAAVTILPMAALTTRVTPRRMLTTAMLLLALSQAGIALAPSLSWVVLLRGLSAMCHGAVWASAPTVAAALLPGRPGRTTAVVFVGSALGNVLGAPLVAWLSALASWRIASAVLALLSAGCALALAWSVPASLRPEKPRRGTAAPSSRDVLAVARWCALVVLIAAAHLATFTFLAERAAYAGVTGTGLAALLLAMGGDGAHGTAPRSSPASEHSGLRRRHDALAPGVRCGSRPLRAGRRGRRLGWGLQRAGGRIAGLRAAGRAGVGTARLLLVRAVLPGGDRRRFRTRCRPHRPRRLDHRARSRLRGPGRVRARAGDGRDAWRCGTATGRARGTGLHLVA